MVPDEEALRRLQAAAEGVDPEPVLMFAGYRFTVRVAGLAPLLRYISAGQPTARERARLECLGEEDGSRMPSQQVALAAQHELLEECLADFPAFSETALAVKISGEDVEQAVLRVIEVTTARPALAGARLLRYLAANLAEIDGTLLLAGGPGLAGLPVRAACNAVFTKLLAQVDPEQRAEWVEGLYLDYDPETQALALVRQMQAAQAAERNAADAGDQVG